MSCPAYASDSQIAWLKALLMLLKAISIDFRIILGLLGETLRAMMETQNNRNRWRFVGDS